MSEFEAATLLLAKWSLAISALSLVGVVLAFVVLRRDVKKDRANTAVRLRDKGREAWIDYLNLCLENPELDVFDIPVENDIGEGGAIERKEQIIIARWFALVSQAFVGSKGVGDDAYDDSVYIHSPEWHSWIRRFTNREHFRFVWDEVKDGYSKEFVAWMDKHFFSE